MAQSVKEQANHFYNTHDWKKIIFSCLIFYVIYLIWANQLKLIKFKIGDSTFQGQALTAYSQEVIQINGTEIGDPCPMIPPNLKTRIPVDLTMQSYEEISTFLQKFSIHPGGFGKPKSCISNFKVAIVIPYRDRDANLKLFLRHLHPFLNKQQLNYAIYLIEPEAGLEFNRGLLMNIGFLEALNRTRNYWECFIFHDVDLLPEDERNLYTCADMPRHMSSAVSSLGYKLPYEAIFGGVTAIRKEQMLDANGFSNMYFGWGGEDDDFRRRFINKRYTIVRYPLEIGRYYMAKHSKDKNLNTERFKLLADSKRRQHTDGLNSIKYRVVSTELNPFYTKIKVSYDKAELRKSMVHNYHSQMRIVKS